MRHRGFHRCEFCQDRKQRGPLVVEHQSKEFRLGFSVIFVFGANATVFAAPDLIVHYVSSHHYQPPQSFTLAVLESVLPPSEAYNAKVESLRTV